MSCSQTVAIMQPTYLPWIGYFAMISQVDKFIFLDSVQFSRRSWQQRNRIKTSDRELMLTIPVINRGKREQLINETEIDLSSNFAQKHWRSIEAAYKKSPYFQTYSELIKEHFMAPELKLVDFNISLIETLCKIFQIHTPRLKSSELNCDGTKSALLAALSKKIGADKYLSAPSSKGYIEDCNSFEVNGITVDYFSFEHPIYPQLGQNFLSHMAAIDLLFNVGADAASPMFQKSLR